MYGQCKHGISCRWGSCHIDAEGKNLSRAESEGGVLEVPVELNQFSTDIMWNLKKNT